MKQLEITLTALIPGDDEELGHEAIVACKGTVNDVVAVLEKLGLTVQQKRRLVTRREKTEEPAAAPKLVA